MIVSSSLFSSSLLLVIVAGTPKHFALKVSGVFWDCTVLGLRAKSVRSVISYADNNREPVKF